MNKKEVTTSQAGTVTLGNQVSVHRMGYGAMRLTGPGIWGPPKDRKAALAVLRRAVELGINFIDTADSYGPHVSEELIAEALHPYPSDLVIATKGGMGTPRAQSVDAQCDARSSSESGRGKSEETAPRTH